MLTTLECKDITTFTGHNLYALAIFFQKKEKENKQKVNILQDQPLRVAQ